MTERVPEFSGKTRGVYLKIRVCSGSRESDLDGTRAGEWNHGLAIMRVGTRVIDNFRQERLKPLIREPK